MWLKIYNCSSLTQTESESKEETCSLFYLQAKQINLNEIRKP